RYPAHYVVNRTQNPHMRFVRDGEDAGCLASVHQVSTPLPDAAAEPAPGADIARAATMIAAGWAPAIPVPAQAADGRLGVVTPPRRRAAAPGRTAGRPSRMA